MKRTIALVLVAGFAIFAPMAQAAKTGTKVTLDTFFYDDETTMATYYYGTVSSAKKACKDDRKVTVYLKQPGKDEVIGSERSYMAKPGDFQWTVTQTGEYDDGTYYAKAKSTQKCKGAKSQEITASPLRRAPKARYRPGPADGR